MEPRVGLWVICPNEPTDPCTLYFPAQVLEIREGGAIRLEWFHGCKGQTWGYHAQRWQFGLSKEEWRNVVRSSVDLPKSQFGQLYWPANLVEKDYSIQEIDRYLPGIRLRVNADIPSIIHDLCQRDHPLITSFEASSASRQRSQNSWVAFNATADLRPGLWKVEVDLVGETVADLLEEPTLLGQYPDYSQRKALVHGPATHLVMYALVKAYHGWSIETVFNAVKQGKLHRRRSDPEAARAAVLSTNAWQPDEMDRALLIMQPEWVLFPPPSFYMDPL